jgi:hypothetical protein
MGLNQQYTIICDNFDKYIELVQEQREKGNRLVTISGKQGSDEHGNFTATFESAE